MHNANAAGSPIAALTTLLEGFAERLTAALGENVVSVILFGGAARGSFDPETSDANVMLLLKKVSLPVLGQVATAAEPVRIEVRLNLLTLAESDLADSSEVFSTKFLDIQRHHRVLWGRDLMPGLVISAERLERQARRELMNLHLRLRQVYLESRRQPERLLALVRRTTTTLLVNLAVLLELRTGTRCESPAETRAAAAIAGIDGAVLDRFLALKGGSGPLVSAEEVPGCYAAYMELVERVLALDRKGGVA